MAAVATMTESEFATRVEAVLRQIEIVDAWQRRDTRLVEEIGSLDCMIAEASEIAAHTGVLVDVEALGARRATAINELKTKPAAADASPLKLRQVPMDMIVDAVLREVRGRPDPTSEVTIAHALQAIALRWDGVRATVNYAGHALLT